MAACGALAEVRALVARGLPSSIPAMKAVGLRELAAHLDGRISLCAAVEAAKRETRRYAKRQLTWFRNQTSRTGSGLTPMRRYEILDIPIGD